MAIAHFIKYRPVSRRSAGPRRSDRRRRRAMKHRPRSRNGSNELDAAPLADRESLPGFGTVEVRSPLVEKKLPTGSKIFRRPISPGALLLAGAVATQALILAGLRITNRIADGHDGFTYLTLQYVFFNSAATTGQIPQWMPYMTHGTIAAWWYGLQAAPLQAALLPLAPWLRSVSFLSLFYLGLFADLLLFTIGIWLLASRFMKSPAAVFLTTVSAALSTLWYNQPFYNLHFFYAVPLVLHFLHLFIERGQARHVFLSGSLFILQIFGDSPDLSAATSFSIGLYASAYVIANRKTCLPILAGAFRRRRLYAVLILLAAMTAGAYSLLTFGTAEIVFHPSFGRSAAGTITFDQFISYLSGVHPMRWAELALGIAPGVDYSLFIGYLALPLIGLSFFGASRRNAQFFVSPLVFALLAHGNRLIAFFFFHLWPFGKFYRHLTLLLPFVRLFLCFLAGIGFEELSKIAAYSSRRRSLARWTLAAVSLGLFLVGGFLAWLQSSPIATYYFMGLYRSLDTMAPVGFKQFPLYNVHAVTLLTAPAVFKENIRRSALFAFAAGTVSLAWSWPLKSRPSAFWIVLGCVVQFADIGSYHVMETLDRTFPLKAAARVLDFQAMPYAQRRLIDIFATPTPRFKSFLLEYPFMGAHDSSHHMFFFADDAVSEFLTFYWMKPTDRLLSAYGVVQVPDARFGPGRPLYRMPFLFPFNNPSAAKLAGVTEDKLQFFSDAHEVADWREAAKIIGGPRYRGDALLLEALSGNAPPASPPSPDLATRNERVSLSYRVTHFDSNHLTVDVDNREDKAHWLFYSDTWHPGWKAKVNGLPAPVYRADLAYKAIPLTPGRDVVEFTFWSPVVFALRCVHAALAWFWLAAIGLLLWRAILAPPGEFEKPPPI
jgi:hypothetical protein